MRVRARLERWHVLLGLRLRWLRREVRRWVVPRHVTPRLSVYVRVGLAARNADAAAAGHSDVARRDGGREEELVHGVHHLRHLVSECAVRAEACRLCRLLERIKPATALLVGRKRVVRGW